MWESIAKILLCYEQGQIKQPPWTLQLQILLEDGRGEHEWPSQRAAERLPYFRLCKCEDLIKIKSNSAVHQPLCYHGNIVPFRR